jgi:hypothetical protein
MRSAASRNASSSARAAASAASSAAGASAAAPAAGGTSTQRQSTTQRSTKEGMTVSAEAYSRGCADRYATSAHTENTHAYTRARAQFAQLAHQKGRRGGLRLRRRHGGGELLRGGDDGGAAGRFEA